MDQVEPPFGSFSGQGEIRDFERFRQHRAQMVLQGVFHRCQMLGGEASAQRDVETEFVPDIRVAELDQVGFLRRRQSTRATLRQFAFRLWPAERIKLGHAGRGKRIERGHVAYGSQSQEATHFLDFQPVHRDRRSPAAEGRKSLSQIVRAAPCRQAHRRFDRGVQSVLSGCRGQEIGRLRQGIDIRLGYELTSDAIPAQPTRSPLRPRRVSGWKIVNSISGKVHGHPRDLISCKFH